MALKYKAKFWEHTKKWNVTGDYPDANDYETEAEAQTAAERCTKFARVDAIRVMAECLVINGTEPIPALALQKAEAFYEVAENWESQQGR